MRPLRALLSIPIVLALLILPACSDDDSGSNGSASNAPPPSAPPPGFSADDTLSTGTPYEPQQDPLTYEAVPAGYKPVFTQLLARHGSRALTSANPIEYVKQLIATADADGALTDLGRALLPEVLKLESANQTLGYGNLSGRGMREHRELAARLLARLPELFADAIASQRRVMVISSGKDRAVDSAKNFAASLAEHQPALASLIDAPVADPPLLYFFKLDAVYQHWLTTDQMLADTIAGIFYSPRGHDEAHRLLERLFSGELVAQLAGGTLHFTDPKSGKSVVLNDVDLAASLYDLYRVAPGLSDESDADLTPFVPQDAASWFGYVNDATEFYEKGPSFRGSTMSFGNARVLQDDFFAVAAANCSAASPLAADLRFGHAETVIPFAALMQLPLSDKQVAPPDIFLYEDNPWRGALVSPYAANIQWDSYANGSGDCLIVMLYNERQTRFRSTCNSLTPDSFYYRLDELQRCYGYR